MINTCEFICFSLLTLFALTVSYGPMFMAMKEFDMIKEKYNITTDEFYANTNFTKVEEYIKDVKTIDELIMTICRTNKTDFLYGEFIIEYILVINKHTNNNNTDLMRMCHRVAIVNNNQEMAEFSRRLLMNDTSFDIDDDTLFPEHMVDDDGVIVFNLRARNHL